MPRSPDDVLNAPTDGMRSRGINGVAAVGGAQAVKIPLQFLSVIILSRLLKPTDFGLVAMVAPISTFVLLFQDLGLTQAVVTSRTVTHGQASTMFWVNVAIAGLLALILFAFAPIAANFYGESRVYELVVALAGLVLISGLTAQQTAMLNRNLRFSILASLDVISSVLNLIGALSFALIWPSPWALIFGTLLAQLTLLVGGWAFSGWHPGRPQKLSSIREMLRIGSGLTGFNLMNFFVRNLDNILIGRTYGSSSLGFYDRAYKLLLFPLQAITRPVGRVMSPVLSRLLDEPARYRHAYLRTIQLLMLMITPGVAALMMCSTQVFIWLVGPKWAPAAPIFTWLAVSGLHQAFSTTFGWLFVSQARTGEFSRWGLINGAVVVIAMLVGLPGGPVGVARAYALADTILLLPILIWMTGRSGPVSSRKIVQTVAPFSLAAGLSIAALSTLPDLVQVRPLYLIIISAAVSYGIFVAVLAVIPKTRSILREAVSIVEHFTARFRKGAAS